MSEYSRDRQAANGAPAAPARRSTPSKAFLLVRTVVGGLLTLFVLWVAHMIRLA